MDSGILRNKFLRRLIGMYLSGTILAGIGLVWGAIDNGGLERHHDLQDWLILIVLYSAGSFLWPMYPIYILLLLARSAGISVTS
jgi:hypothetical protein